MTFAPPQASFQHLAYGGLGLPLAFAALPLYVQWPAHMAQHHGLPLAGLGLLLLVVRAGDAIVDPWLGRWVDRRAKASERGMGAWALAAMGGLGLTLGLTAMVLPPQGLTLNLLWLWSGLALMLTMLGYSLASITHLAWGARLGDSGAARARWVAWREGLALVGVILASLLPSRIGWPLSLALLAVLMVLALAGLRLAPWGRNDLAPSAVTGVSTALASPWRWSRFRRLALVFLLNGLASAIPATLLLFYLRDRLMAPQLEAASLGLYFLSAAAATPLWLRLIDRWGLLASWMAGMALSILAFAGAATLSAGDGPWFLLVCALTGAALGADLVVPAALLASVLQLEGLRGRAEGQWFGWWSLLQKLALALAAGLALPLLEALGYRYGADTQTAHAQMALIGTYAVLPCVFKLAALLGLWFGLWPQRHLIGRSSEASCHQAFVPSPPTIKASP